MRSSRFQTLLVGLFAFVLAGVFLFGLTAFAVEDEEDGGTYTGIPKDKSCTWWLDESKEVPKEDKAEIKKLFEALEKKLEKDGLDSVTFPWKPPEDEEDKEAEEEKEEVELTDEQKKWEEDELFEDPETCPGVIIPSKDDINVAKVDGVPTGTLFIVRGTFDDPRLEVWRMKLAKKDDEWSVIGREIEYSFEPVYTCHMRKNTAYKFSSISFDHDLMHISMTEGRFYPVFSGNEKIIGGVVFGKGTMSYRPPTKLAKDWETDQELNEFRLFTEKATGKQVDEFNDVKLTKLIFFFSPTNVENYLKLEDLEKFEITDRGELKNAEELVEGEMDWLAGTKWGVKLPYKGQPEGEKKLVSLYYFQDYDELCNVFAYGPKYQWVGYYDYPTSAPSMRGGDQEEINLYVRREMRLKAGDEKTLDSWCAYNRKDQRESLTRREAEYEPTDDAKTLHRAIDTNIGYKEEVLSSDQYGVIARAYTGIYAKFRTTIDMEITKADTNVLPFSMYFFGQKQEVVNVVDERGLDVLRIGNFTLVYPPLALGQRIKFTSEYNGVICQRMLTTNSYTSGNCRWFPVYGYLECATFDLVVGVPRPYTAASVGALTDSWSEDKTNFAHWSSDECIRMAAILYSDYNVARKTFEKPNGEQLEFMLYYYPKMHFYLVYGDFYSAALGGLTGVDRGRAQTYLTRIRKREFSVRSPDSIVTEFESIWKWLQGLYHPLPYKKIAAVMLPITSGYGQGQPSMLTLDGWSFVSEGDKALYEVPPGRWGAEFWAHEAGHQYWGHVVCWKAGRDQWFSEAFTENQCALYMQASRSDDEFRLKLKRWRDWTLMMINQGVDRPMTLGGRLGSRNLEWYATFYNKGPYVLYHLRSMIGDKAYIAYCRNILKSMYWKSAVTSDFIQVLEQTLGKENMLNLFGKDNMQWFFDQWIYGTGIPSYEFGYEISGNTAKIKIKHTGAQFRVRIPIWVYDTSGNKYAIPVLLTGEKPIEEFELKLRGPAKKLVLDEFDSVLTKKIKKVKYKKIK